MSLMSNEPVGLPRSGTGAFVPFPFAARSHVVTLRLAEDTVFADRFGTHVPFQLGVEEELFLVDPQTHELLWCADELLARYTPEHRRGHVTGEMCDGVVELATPICATADEAADALGALRHSARRYDDAVLLGAGGHPTLPFGAARHRGGRHYDAVGRDTGAVLRQSACCGLHVHVGMPDAETAIVAFNGMRKWMPLLQALGSNSPYWHGQDSGMASTRTVRIHDMPRSGLPRAFRDWADYRQTMRELIRVADVDGPGSLWWDLRPHPSLGTLEVRVLDAQSSLEDVRGLVALVHCLTYHEALTADPRHPSKEILDEAAFHAVRDGLDARFSVGGPMHHVHGLARLALDLAWGYAHELGCRDSLGALERLLTAGNGADRQRRAFEQGGMRAVLAQLADATAAPPASPAAGPLTAIQGAA
jgi:glutamate---cysteine ligase / carboxylate-amine ligase